MRALLVLSALLAATPAAAQLAPVTVDHIDLVQSRPITRTRYEFLYRVTVKYNGAPGSRSPGAHNLRAQVASSAATTVISDGEVSFGTVATGVNATSSDTFSIIQDRTRTFDRSVLSYDFQYDADVAVLPSFLGMSQEEAAAALTACCGASFSNVVHENDPNAPPGTIARTDPPAGTPLTDLGFEPYRYVNLYLSSGPDHTSQFGATLASSSFTLETGDSLPLRIQIDRTAGFVEPVTLELENPPNGITATPLSVGPQFPTPQLTIFADPQSLDRIYGNELVVRATAGGQSVHIPFRVSPIPRKPSSGELIQAALDSGAINLETSYVYRMYAMMGDPRLPAQFAGGTSSGGEDSELMLDIAQHEESLSNETRALLHPYLARPSDPDSVWSQPLMSAAFASAPSGGSRPVAAAAPTVTILPEQSCPFVVQDPTWIYKRVTSGVAQALLWIRCDPIHPEFTRLVFDTYFDALSKVWGPEIQLMGAPAPDLGGTATPFDPDGAIDVYIVPSTAIVERGQFRSLSSYNAIGVAPQIDVGDPKRWSSYVLVDDSLVALANGDDHIVLSHELFHVLEARYNVWMCYEWIEEAAAEWAAIHFDFVLDWPARGAPKVFQTYFPSFVTNPHPNSPELALYDAYPEAKGRYRSFMWLFYIQRVLGRQQGAELVAELWRRLEPLPVRSAPIRADLDAVLDGLFPYADHYPNFALLNVRGQYFYPGDPVPDEESYRDLDPAFPIRAPFDRHSEIDSPSRNRQYVDGDDTSYDGKLFGSFDLRPLQTEYLWIDVTDGFIREIDVSWDAPSRLENLTVDSVARVRDEDFKVERVRSPVGQVFCIPEGNESQGLIGYLMFSNGAYLPGQGISNLGVSVTRRYQPSPACGCQNPPAGSPPNGHYCVEAMTSSDNDLSTELAHAINHYGLIAGEANFNLPLLQPAVWSSGPPIPLLPVVPFGAGRALRINDYGDVAGYVGPGAPTGNGNVAFWPNDHGSLGRTFFPLPYPTVVSTVDPGPPFVGLNNQHAVAYSTNGHVYLRSYAGSTVSEIDVGPGDAALDVNEYNHVLVREGGRNSTLYPAHDSLWRSGVRTPLPILAEAVNDDDVVVGEWVDPNPPPGGALVRPARWKNGSYTLLDIPGVPPPPFSSDPNNATPYQPGTLRDLFVTDINNRGEMVGFAIFAYLPRPGAPPNVGQTGATHGLYWSPDGHVTDLFYAVPSNANVSTIVAINDLGWMAGQGFVGPPASDCQREVIGCGAFTPLRVRPFEH